MIRLDSLHISPNLKDLPAGKCLVNTIIDCHCGTIGAVFDFYVGTAGRTPQWMQKAGLEWLHRLLNEGEC